MNTTLTDLTPLGIIKITGPDAEKFLQGQLTCNVQEVTAQQSRLGAHCDHKGRMQATFRLFKYQTDYFLQIPKNLIEHLLQCLKKYAVFSKVTLTDVSADWQQLGVSGTDCVKVLNEAVSAQLPEKIDDAITYEQFIIIRLTDNNPRFCLLGANLAIEPLKKLILSQCEFNDFFAWQLQDINAGIPSLFPETIGLFTPHQINYPAINGVSFNKGCYTGQEIVARMQFLGKLKQHMYKIVFTSSYAIAPSAAIITATSVECGTLVEAVKTAEDQWQGLATIYDNKLRESLYIENLQQPIQQIQELSYTHNI